MTYKGYEIKRTKEGDYIVKLSPFTVDVACNLKTAKKWIDSHIKEYSDFCQRHNVIFSNK